MTAAGASMLRQRAADYLALRRAVGYKLAENERPLTQFLDYLEEAGITAITTQIAVAWAVLPSGAKPVYWRRRLSVVRCFAVHLAATDPAVEVPPAAALRCFPNRTAPHLYSDAEILALMDAAGTVFRQPLRQATYRTLIGLLAVTGMRAGEAVRLDRDHIDLEARVLSVIRSKYGKSRQVLLHASTASMLAGYADLRDRTVGTLGAPAFFVSTRGRLLVNTADYVFASLVKAVGIPPGPKAALPGCMISATRFRCDLAGVVSRGRRCPGPASGAVHLARPHVTGLDLLVPEGNPRAACPGRRAPRTPQPLLRSTVMATFAPVLEAFFTDRLITSAGPARTPSPPTATRSGCCWDTPSSAPARTPPTWTSPTWTPR